MEPRVVPRRRHRALARAAKAGLDPRCLAAVERAPVDPEVGAEITRAFDEFAVDLRPCPCPRQRGSRQMVCPHRRGQPDRRDRRVGQAVGAQEPPDHPAGQRAWRHRRPWCDQRTEGHSRPGAHVPGVITAGTFHIPGERVFWDVHDPAKAVVIELADEHYARLVVQVADPRATVALVENSTQRP
jgi:hypothetical protein